MSEFDRYTTEGMSLVWSGDWKLRRWAEIEVEAARALGAPGEALAQMRSARVPKAAEVDAEEAVTRHDVVAFLNLWRQGMGQQGRAWSHMGLTSSDVVDTANGMRMAAATDLIRYSLNSLIRSVVKQAKDYRAAWRVGRTHGQHAELTTWGWRMAGFAFDLDRAKHRLGMAEGLYRVGKLSGPVGDYKTLAPEQERRALHALGLNPVAATQVVPRDVYVDYVHALAQIASVVESIALEVRLSARTEVGEVREGFGALQRGSSAMPHKRNPITAEKLCGLARVVRAQVEPVAQGVALHHERDISHSSVERLALALASQVTDYMLNTCRRMVDNLRVNPQRMWENARNSPELLSSMIKNRLVEEGFDPGFAYDVVFWGFNAWENDRDKFGWTTVAEALSATWIEHSWGAKIPAEAEIPDFAEMLQALDDPASLVGQTNTVYQELELLLGAPTV